MTRPLALLVLFLVGLVPAACRHVPDDVVKGNAGSNGAGETSYADLVARAREAWQKTPRSIESVSAAREHYAAAIRARADDSVVLLEAARVAMWLGEFLESREDRRPITKDGITYTNTVLKLQPENIEARYLHGVLAGLLGDVDHDYGLNAARTVDQDMRGLIEKNADIGHAGPWRVLGVLQMRAPGPPTSVGSLRNARKNLLAAVERAPDWPENHLYCAEMEFTWAKEKDLPAEAQNARDRLQKHLLGPQARAPAGAEYEFAIWQAKARELLKSNP